MRIKGVGIRVGEAGQRLQGIANLIIIKARVAG